MLSDPRTPLPPLFPRRKYRLRQAVQSIALLLCALALPGCEGSTGNAPSATTNANASTQTSAATGQPTENTSKTPSDPASGDTDTPLAPLLPPGENAPAPGQGTGLTAFPGMQPPKGLNVETLFAEDIQDPMARIKRLENVVLDMRRDFNTVLPPIMRLVAVEQDMQNLIGQLETLVDQPSTGTAPEDASAPEILNDAPASEDLSGSTQQTLAPQAGQEIGAGTGTEIEDEAQPQPQPQNAALKTEETSQAPPAAAPPTTSGTGPIHLRVSPHAEKTRLVLETSGTTAFRSDLDNTEHILVIELPEAAAKDARGKETVTDAPLIREWSVEAMETGTGARAIIELNGAAKIQKTLALPADDQSPARIILDLVPETQP